MGDSMICEVEGHDERKRDPEWWAEQVFIGIQDCGDGHPALICKNCRSCGSTVCLTADLNVMPDKRSAL